MVASPTSTAPGGAARLQAARGVDHVAGDHPLADRADRDRRLPGEHAGAGLHGRPELADAAHDLQGGAHRPLGVVLVARRRAPDGHDRVADELLDRAAVALDDAPGQVEVAREQVADLLRVALLGERGEADHVGEEDGDEAALGDDRDRGLGPRRGRPDPGRPRRPRASPHTRRRTSRPPGWPPRRSRRRPPAAPRTRGRTCARDRSARRSSCRSPRSPHRIVGAQGTGPRRSGIGPPGAMTLEPRRRAPPRALPSGARGRLGPGGLPGLQNRCGRA